MAPTGTPKKGASTKAATPKKTQSPIKKTKVRSKVTVTDLGTKSTEAITFLWAALQHELNKNNSGVDYQAVGDALGITKCAATFRYYRIRDAFANDAENAENPDQEGGEESGAAKPRSRSSKSTKLATNEHSESEDATAPGNKSENFEIVIKEEEPDTKIKTEQTGQTEQNVDCEANESEAEIRRVKVEEVDFEA